MGIVFDFINAAKDTLSTESQEALAERGALDPDQVLIEFHTQEDDRVRPTHAALDGTVWRPGDPDAPVPPLDWNCRCFVSYRSKPATDAAKVLPTTDLKALRMGEHYAKFLDDKLPGWKPFLKDLHSQHLAKLDQMGECVLFVQEAKPTMAMADVREYARMLVQADTNG